MRFRLARPADLLHGQKLVHPGFRCSPHVSRAMPEIWREHLRTRAMRMGIVEDPLRAVHERLLFLGVPAFVSDSFFDAFSAKPQPHLAGR